MRFSSALSKFVLVGCMMGATVPVAFAQEEGNRPGRGGGQGGPGGGGPGGGGRGMRMGGGMMGGGGLSSLLRMKEVRTELKVDEDQTKELDTTAEEMMKEMRSMMQAGQAGGPPDMSKMREMSLKADSKIEEILDPKQMDRLLGLLIQRDGVRSVNTAALATRLKISDEQKTKMADVEKAAGESLRSLFSGGPPGPEVMEKMQTMRKESDEKLQEILTAEQKATMESMKGDKFEFPAPQFGPGGPGGPGGRGGRGQRGGQGS